MSRGDDDDDDEPAELKVTPAEPAPSASEKASAVAPAAAIDSARPEKLEVNDSDSEEGSDDESEDGFIDGLDKIQAEGVEPCKMVRSAHARQGPPARSAPDSLCAPVAGSRRPDRPRHDQGQDCGPVLVSRETGRQASMPRIRC